MTTFHPALTRAQAFANSYGLRVPILLGPMAGACPPSLSIAVANAGGLGACGALLMQPAAIKNWAAEVRAKSNGAFALNLWIPDPTPHRHAETENAVRAFLGEWGPEVHPQAGDAHADLKNFAAMSQGATKWLATAAAYVLPNFASLNVIAQVAHEQGVSAHLVFFNTVYALLYSVAITAAAVLIFERRNLK